jgi:hypothetical protein
LNTAFGLAWVMVMLASLALLAVVFVAAFLPETKHVPLEEVTAAFERKASGRKPERVRT